MTKKILLVISSLLLVGCATTNIKLPSQPPSQPIIHTINIDVVLQSENGAPIPNIQMHVNVAQDTFVDGVSNEDGYALFSVPDSLVDSFVRVDGNEGFEGGEFPLHPTSCHDGCHNIIRLASKFPPIPSRWDILNARESFQGAVLTTSCFGTLNWWPTAFVSLSPACREEAYPQIRSWGDTDITVSASWNYGEPGQPYGSGQLVPNIDFVSSGRLVSDFRPIVKEVIQKGFIPRIFMEGDNGYAYYMWAMPQIIAALQPQPNDPIDLTPYVKLQMCYDSCIPGYAGAKDDKSLINDAILQTRLKCPNCVIALEFSSGYASTGDGDAWWQTDAAKAIDEVDWEGNSWPISNFDQYWQILDRWLGPAFIRDPAMPKGDDDGAPFPANSSFFYLRNGTPRGPYLVHCFEPYTYQWVRGQVAPTQVRDAFMYMKGLGCPVIDTPQF